MTSAWIGVGVTMPRALSAWTRPGWMFSFEKLSARGALDEGSANVCARGAAEEDMYVALTPCAARQAAKVDRGQRDNSDELAHYTLYAWRGRIPGEQRACVLAPKGLHFRQVRVPDLFRKENHRFHDHHSSRGRQRPLVRVLIARYEFPKCASWTPTASRLG
jgi:hypothetical protein